MKVKIKDLRPNPFRDMERYPIDAEKVDSLINSINETGFWDNLLARQSDDHYEIAYGHHRLLALTKIHGEKSGQIIDIPVKKLTDDQMLRIMAEENNEYYKTNVAVVNETVLAVWKHLCESGLPIVLIQEGAGDRGFSFPRLPIPDERAKESIIANQIAAWIGKNWPVRRVADSLRWLHRSGDIKDPGKDKPNVELDRTTLETMPTLKAARIFSDEVEAAGLSKPAQRRVASQLNAEEDYSGNSIRAVIVDEIHDVKKQKEQKAKRELREFKSEIKGAEKLAVKLNAKFTNLIRFREFLSDPIYAADIANLGASIKLLLDNINKLKGGNSNVKQLEA